ncbi:MAG TPA: STM3941 family protein [Ktedonobacterales bacterium]
MRDMREIRYYASIPKLLLLLIGSAAFVAIGWSMQRVGDNLVFAWMAIVLFGLCALVVLAMLIFAVVLRQPLLVINSAGITARQALLPWWRTAFVPWPDIARIRVRTVSGASATSISQLLIYARNRDRYNPSARGRRFVDAHAPIFQGVALSAPFALLLTWASRKRCLAVVERIKQTFAPEIIQYNITVDDA